MCRHAYDCADMRMTCADMRMTCADMRMICADMRTNALAYEYLRMLCADIRRIVRAYVGIYTCVHVCIFFGMSMRKVYR